VNRLSAIHFQRIRSRLVSYYALIIRCQLPWPPPNCLRPNTTFLGSRLTITFALYLNDWSIPNRPSCLPRKGPLEFIDSL